MPKKVVNGKRYNTESSTKLCDIPDGKLYRKHARNLYFIWYNDDSVKELTYDDAKELMDKYGSEEKKSEPETRPSYISSAIHVSQAEIYTISDEAAKLGITNRAFVMLCVEEYIRNHSQKPDS